MPLIKHPAAVLGRLSLLLALIAAGSAPLLVGAVHPASLVLVTGIAICALLVHVVDRHKTGRRIPVSWFLAPLLLGLASALFHLLPLPEFIRSLLAPDATETLRWMREALPPQYQSQVHRVLSLDAAATAQSALRLIAASSVFVVVADRCRERSERRFAFHVVLFFGAALFLVSLGHRLASAQRIYGMFAPNGFLPLYGPLINPNHLARAFGVLGLLLLGRGLFVRSRTEAAVFVVVGGLLCAGVFATVSRGGIVALFAALLCGLAFYLYASRVDVDSKSSGSKLAADLSETPGKNIPLIASLIIAAILLLMGSLLWDRLASEAGREISIEGTKLKLVGVGLRLLQEHWQVGVGSGAFSSGVTQVMRAGDFNRELTVVFSENIIVETLTTHGIVVASALFVLALVALFSVLRNIRIESAFSIAAVVFLFVGEIFDFAFEVGFGALLGGLALGFAVAPTIDLVGRKISAKKVGVVASVCALLTVWLSVLAIVEDNRTMERNALAVTGEVRETALLEGMAAHPFNAWYAYGLAVSSREKRDAKGAMKWTSRALYLRPTYARAHLEAARVLWALGKRDQALLEYRLAWENRLGPVVVAEVAKRTTDLDAWVRVVPQDRPHTLIELCKSILRRRADATVEEENKRREKAQACVDKAAAAPKATTYVKSMAVNLAIQRGDLEGARQRFTLVQESLSRDQRGAMDIRLTELADGRAAAREKAQRYLQKTNAPKPILRWVLQDARRQKDYGLIHGTVSQLRHHVSKPKELRELDLIEIDAWLGEGETTRGLRGLSTLSRRHPNDVALLTRTAHLQAKLGLTEQARYTLKKVLRIAPKNSGALESLQELGANTNE